MSRQGVGLKAATPKRTLREMIAMLNNFCEGCDQAVAEAPDLEPDQLKADCLRIVQEQSYDEAPGHIFALVKALRSGRVTIERIQ